ncbi:MAG: hypothetical protein ABSF28_07345 [Terracidiphilus sp.]|jgi:hypothetical protein
MKSELVLFGQHINMAPRVNRRRLVVLFYGIFGALLLANWFMGLHSDGAYWTVMFTLLVGPILGGYFSHVGNLGRRGLVEPFKAERVLKYPESVSILKPSTLLYPVVDNDPQLRVDERTLRRRDYAHSLAYRFLGALVSVGFILEFCSNSSSVGGGLESIGLSSNSANRIIYYLLQISYVPFLTLPQAILLWTEPDMEAEG